MENLKKKFVGVVLAAAAMALLLPQAAKAAAPGVVSPTLVALTSSTLQVSWTLSDPASDIPRVVLSTTSLTGNGGPARDTNIALSSAPAVGGVGTLTTTYASAPFPLLANTTYFFEVKLSTEGDTATCTANPNSLTATDCYVSFNNGYSTSTLAGPPTAIVAGGVGSNSVTVTWNANGNPTGTGAFTNITTYTVILSTYASGAVNNYFPSSSNNYSVLFTTRPSGSATPQATLVNGTAGLVGQIVADTTYFMYVLAWNNNGVPNAGGFQAAAASTATLASAPAATLTSVALGPGTIGVPWGANFNPINVTTYTVIFATVTPLTSTNYSVFFATMSQGASLWATVANGGAGVVGTFAVNTTYFVFVDAYNQNGSTGTYTSLAPVSTLPNPPTTIAAAGVGASSVTVTWNLNGNPAGTGGFTNITTYTVVLSTINTYSAGTYSVLYTTMAGAGANTVTLANGLGGGLLGSMAGTITANTTYFAFVQAVNYNGFANLGGFQGPSASTATMAAVPAVTTNPGSTGTGVITVAWGGNGNPINVTTYTVLLATVTPVNGSNYSILFTTMPQGSSLSATLSNGAAGVVGAFSPNTTYYAFVAAFNQSGSTTAGAALGSTSTFANPPTTIVAGPTGFNSMTVKWNANSNPSVPTGGLGIPNVTTYTVVLSTINTFSAGTYSVLYTTAPSNAAGTLQASLANGLSGMVGTITADTTYFLFVQAQNNNQIYTGYQLGASSSTLAAGPTAITLASLTNTSMIMQWALNGNPANPTGAVTYQVVLSTVNTTPPNNTASGNFTLTSTAPVGVLPQVTATGLLTNTTYFAWVNALNHGGDAPATGSGYQGPTSTSTLALSVKSVAAASTSTSAVTVSWNANSNNLSVTSYTVVLATGSTPSPASNYSSIVLSTMPAGSSPQVTITNALLSAGVLAPSAYYTPFVAALNNDGVATVYVAGTPGATFPMPPVDVPPTFAVDSSTQAQIVWSSGTTTNGFDGASTTYTIVMSTWNGLNLSASGNVTASSSPANVLPSATITGLTPNTTYWPFISATNATGSSTTYNVALDAFATQAAVPTATATVNGTSIVLSWVTNSNPAGTTYYATISTDPAFGALTNSAVTFSQTSTAFSGLSGGQNYYMAVWAVNAAGVFTSSATPGVTVTGGSSVAAPTKAATTFTAINLSSITVAWTAATGASQYLVYMSTQSNFQTIAASSLTANTSVAFGKWAGGDALSPGNMNNNTQFYFQVQSTNTAGASAFLSLGSTYTLAAAPVLGSIVPSATSAVYTWTAGGSNPSYTIAWVDRSTGNVSNFTQKVSSQVGPVVTYTDTNLLGCTSYYVRIQNISGSGAGSPYDGGSTPDNFLTLGTTPTAPSGFTATSLANDQIQLTWNGSLTEGVVSYRLYTDNQTGIIPSTGTVPYATFSSTMTNFTWTTPTLSNGTYQFKLTAVHRCLVEEPSGATASALAVGGVPTVRATIASPLAGANILSNSNNLTLQANVTGGTASSVVFQFKNASTLVSTYTTISTVSAAAFGNTFSFVWDLTNADVLTTNLSKQLPVDSYLLRAVAYDVNGSSDYLAVPSLIKVVAAGTAGAAGETISAAGIVTLQFVTSANASLTVATQAPGQTPVNVAIPAGTFVDANGLAIPATLTFSPNPDSSTVPLLPAVYGTLGSVTSVPKTIAKIGATDALGNTIQPKAGQVAVTFGYTDSNASGVVDNTTMRADAIKLFSNHTGAAGSWVQDIPTTNDSVKKTISGKLPAFSFVQGAVTAAADLSGVRIYPNPYKPDGANANEGRPFVAGLGNTGIVFDQLPVNVTIKIYTITGNLVTQFSTTNGTGTLIWDARNNAGRNVASGGYFAVISSPGSKSVTKTLAIIR